MSKSVNNGRAEYFDIYFDYDFDNEIIGISEDTVDIFELHDEPITNTNRAKKEGNCPLCKIILKGEDRVCKHCLNDQKRNKSKRLCTARNKVSN